MMNNNFLRLLALVLVVMALTSPAVEARRRRRRGGRGGNNNRPTNPDSTPCSEEDDDEELPNGGAAMGQFPENGHGMKILMSPGSMEDESEPEPLNEVRWEIVGPIREHLVSPFREDPGEFNETAVGEVDERGRRQLNVFLPDTRVNVNEHAYPYRTVGKYRGCTATLVHNTGIVVTNAHCLKFKNNGQLDPATWSYSFYAGFSHGTYLAASKPKALWYDKSDDYAVFKLWTPLDQQVGRMGVSWKNIFYFWVNRNMNMISYSGDHCTKWSNCNQKRSSGKSRAAVWDNVYHDLDAKRGSSGSAMYHWKNGWPYMIALNFAEDRNGGQNSLTLNSYTGFNPNLAKPAIVWKTGYNMVKNA